MGNILKKNENRAVLVVPVMAHERRERSIEAQCKEIGGLACAIHLDIACIEAVKISRIDAGKLFTAGGVEKISIWAEKYGAGLLIIDSSLTPIQQRNLERELKMKVLDRTGLILEIFGERARTAEGQLQVDLAHLIYQKSRLVRSWTHLERQRAAAGFMGGPGETQIEADRRQIQTRILSIRRKLDKVRKTRALHRKQRRQAPWSVIALVGYTNAGKSTLFNTITKSEVVAENMLFATLDPTLRMVKLPGGRKIMLADTVGFVSALPTELIAAFRATLEEVLEADIILHIRDISHSDSAVQKQDVLKVLGSLGVQEHVPILEVLNKSDLLDETKRSFWGDGLLVSAEQNDGMDRLLERIEQELSKNIVNISLELSVEDGQALAWLHRNGEMLSEKGRENGNLHITARLDKVQLGRFCKKYPHYHPNKVS